jgi:hypothetical protein
MMGWHASVSEKAALFFFREEWPVMYLATVQGMRGLWVCTHLSI